MTTTPNPAESLAAFDLHEQLENAHSWAKDYDPLKAKSQLARVNPRFLVALIEHALASGPSAGAEPVKWLLGVKGEPLNKHSAWEREPTESELQRISEIGSVKRNQWLVTPLYATPAATPPAEKEVRVPQAWGGIDATGKLVDCSLSREDIEHAGLRAVPLGITGEANEQ